MCAFAYGRYFQRHSRRPRFEALETRGLAAIGQYTLLFQTPPTFKLPLGGTLDIDPRGDLPNGAIDVASFQFSTPSTSTSLVSATTGAGGGKVVFTPLTIQTHGSSASESFGKTESNSSFYGVATLVVRDAAARPTISFSFTGLKVASQIFQADSNGLVETDQLMFVGLTTHFLNPNLGLTPTGPTTKIQLAPTTLTSLQNPPTGTTPQIQRSTAHPEQVTYHAKVTSGSGVAAGNVTFYAGASLLGTVPLGRDGSAALTLPKSSLPSGTAKTYAVFYATPNGAGPTAQPSCTVGQSDLVHSLFKKYFGRTMHADEWVWTSLWLNRGLTIASLTNSYKSLSGKKS